MYDFHIKWRSPMLTLVPTDLTPDPARRVEGPPPTGPLHERDTLAGYTRLHQDFVAASPVGARWHLYSGEPCQHAGPIAHHPCRSWRPGAVERCRERALRLEQDLDERAFKAGAP